MSFHRFGLDSSPGGVGVRRETMIAACVVLLVGCSLSLIGAVWFREITLEEGGLQFERRADRLVTEIQRRVNLSGYGLKGARGMYMASEKVTRAEFRAYVNSRDLEQEFPGAIGFGLIERVPRSDLENYIARERADDAPNYDVYPETEFEYLYPIKYIEPLETNRAAWGFDVGSESRRRHAIERAISTGETRMTARLDLVQDDLNLSGFLYYVPFYNKGAIPVTPEEREEQLLGVLYAPIIIDYAFSGIADFTDGFLRFDVFEEQEEGGMEQLFDFDRHLSVVTGLTSEGANKGRAFHRSHDVLVGGRTWNVQIASTSRFDSTIDPYGPFLIGIGGIVLTVLLAAILWVFGNNRYRALQLATHMTSDLADAKARADAANQSKSEFLANMSHEIRTPLTAILGYANILQEEGDLSKAPPRRVEAVKTILSGGEHLLQIINDILDLSKIEAGKMSMEAIETPFLDLIQDIEAMMLPRAKAKGLSLTTRFVTPVPDLIIADPTRLRQVLMNLVGNALKFTDTGAVVIHLEALKVYQRDVIQVTIEDTGAGMTEEQAKHLFEPFSQADGTVTRKYGGTGLGLTISRRLAQSMNGDVKLLRTAPGEGSVFQFTHPATLCPNTRKLDAFPENDGDSPEITEGVPKTTLLCRVLLAEDNPVNQKLLKHHLTKAGARVDVVSDGQEALQAILSADQTDDPYRLLVSDMQMPEMDGYTLARTLRDRSHNIPIIAMTAHAMAEDRRKCLDAGCNDYVTKPIEKKKFLDTCRRWSGIAG